MSTKRLVKDRKRSLHNAKANLLIRMRKMKILTIAVDIFQNKGQNHYKQLIYC